MRWSIRCEFAAKNGEDADDVRQIIRDILKLTGTPAEVSDPQLVEEKSDEPLG